MKKTKMLKKNYEFKRVLTKGKYYSGKCIEAFIKQNYNDLNFIGIAVSSKAGNAVKRNYVKRIIRAGYTELEGKIKKGYSIVFFHHFCFFHDSFFLSFKVNTMKKV